MSRGRRRPIPPSDNDEPREYVEARVVLPDWQLERFLDFCENQLHQLPELTRLDPSKLNGHKELLDMKAAQEDGKSQAKVAKKSWN